MKKVLYLFVLSFFFAGCKKDIPLKACFDFTPDNSAPTTLITFTNCSDIATEYRWDFGDGSGTSILVSPTYSYSLPGTYVVKLTVSGNGKSTTTTRAIVVSACPDGYEGPNCTTPAWARFYGTYDVSEVLTKAGGGTVSGQYVMTLNGAQYGNPKGIVLREDAPPKGFELSGTVNGNQIAFDTFTPGSTSVTISNATASLSTDGRTLTLNYTRNDPNSNSGTVVATGIRR